MPRTPLPSPRLVALGVLCAALAAPAGAEVPPAQPPQVTAARTATPPRIDGVVDEAVWESALVIDDFVQQLPLDGVPPTEPTVVRILYDDTNLYLAIICYDAQPSKIRITSLERDFFQNAGESVAVAIDSSNSGRDGFWFSTNPAGAQNDSQVFNEGQIFDPSWDGIWESAGTIGPEGWSVEVRLPFFNLRFQEADRNVMRINFFRNLKHKNEEMYAPAIPRNYRGTFSFSIGRPVVFEGISRGRRVDVKPYGLLSSDRTNLAGTTDTDVEGQIGLDNLKWGITPDLTLDFTVNPDFAEAEADVFQVNLDRFPLFFPEKREFFLENAGLFQFGNEQQTQAFFSRRIGLDAQGEVVPILSGARLTGRTGPWSLGVLDVVTDDNTVQPRTNFFVARVRRDLGKRSTAGLIVTDREAQGDGGGNRVVGGDVRFVFGEDVFLQGYAMASESSPGSGGDGYAGRLEYSKEGDRWRWYVITELIDEEFDAGIGFVRRPGVELASAGMAFRPRPASIPAVRQYEFKAGADYIRARVADPDLDGERLDQGIDLRFETEFESGDRFEAGLEREDIRITEDFAISDGVVIPPGDYANSEAEVEVSTWEARPVSAFFYALAGDFFGGRRQGYGAGVTARFNEHFQVETSYRLNRIRLPYGDFDTNLWVTRFRYGFTPTLFGSALVQWNDLTDDVDLNLRLDWIHHPGADLFLVYNQSLNSNPGPGEPRTNFRQGIAKLTWLFHF